MIVDIAFIVVALILIIAIYKLKFQKNNTKNTQQQAPARQ